LGISGPAGAEQDMGLPFSLWSWEVKMRDRHCFAIGSLEDEGRLGQLTELVDYIEGREPRFPFDLTGRQFS